MALESECDCGYDGYGDCDGVMMTKKTTADPLDSSFQLVFG
jgi:hypothetical protein